MWFLIKGAFWFSLVLILLPIFGKDDPATSDTSPRVDVADTVSAATEALGYLGAICMEKPDVCEKGAETFTALGHRAREGARIAYQLLDDQFGKTGDPVTTGTVATGDKAKAGMQPAEPANPAPVSEEQASEPAFSFTRIPVPEKRIEPSHNRAS